MSKTIVVSSSARPVMEFVERDPGKPGPGEIACGSLGRGVRFCRYPLSPRHGPRPFSSQAASPLHPGLEAVGVIEDVGLGVSQFKAGERVGYASSLTIGAYAEVRLFPADRAFRLPADISDVDAAA